MVASSFYTSFRRPIGKGPCRRRLFQSIQELIVE